MTSPPDWTANGLDKERCKAVIKLFRQIHEHNRRYTPPTTVEKSHLEPASNRSNPVDPEIHLDSESDNSRSEPEAHFNPGTSSLQRAFLARLAEVLVSGDGKAASQHVATTLMIGNRERMTVLVARNSKLRSSDVVALDGIQTLLRSIASEGTRIQDNSDHPRALWKALLEFHKHRIQKYASDVERFLNFLAEDFRSLPHNAHLELLLSQLREWTTSGTDRRNEVLVLRAHEIYETFSAGDFGKLSLPGAHRLRNALGFLGRIRAAFLVFLRAARELPGFRTLRIIGARMPGKLAGNPAGKAIASVEADNQTWTFFRLVDYLGVGSSHKRSESPYRPGSIDKHPGDSNGMVEAGKLQAATSQFDAELQMLSLYHDLSLNLAVGDKVDYIGCNKRSGFLCWHFLEAASGTETREYEGELYNLWELPVLHDLDRCEKKRVLGTLEGLATLPVRTMLDCWGGHGVGVRGVPCPRPIVF